mmetsp:Transcript_7234/g.16605  ORF Transcript_7234/g.16605 Transcript_7234/m.16605 type:complete len:82 (-) Transcript_7234:68-313(-)
MTWLVARRAFHTVTHTSLFQGLILPAVAVDSRSGDSAMILGAQQRGPTPGHGSSLATVSPVRRSKTLAHILFGWTHTQVRC